MRRSMPHRQSPRPGLRNIQAAGDDWAEEKMDDLTQTFGQAAIIGDRYTTPSNHVRYRAIQLSQHVTAATPIQFIVEAEFPVGGHFQAALGIADYHARFGVVYTELRPDIIVVFAPGTFNRYISADGTVRPLPHGDTRRQLRVIDIKMTAQASPGYFAEIALYSMALAGWLADAGHEQDFVVVPDGAVWPGAYEASHLLRFANQTTQRGLTPTTGQLWTEMERDLEPVPFEVFALRIRRFLQVDVVQALSQPWQTLEWHVDSRCSFCEYLGEERPASQIARDPQAAPHDDHCLPMATRLDHMSRVAFVSQGARLSLARAGVSQVAGLASRQASDPVFDTHQTLRAREPSLRGGRTPFNPARSCCLRSAGLLPGCRNGPTFGFTCRRISTSGVPSPSHSVSKPSGSSRARFNSPLTTPKQTQLWPSTSFPVDSRDLATERRELLAFLGRIHEILQWCQQHDQQAVANPLLAGLTPRQRTRYRTSVQFYIWDTLQFDHLTRVIGRHLPFVLANTTVNYLAWLFPPPELLPNADMATRRSPITIVRDVIRTLLAAPIPHYYGLLEVARIYHDPRTGAVRRPATPR